jgi:hypothetical protein
MTTKNEFLLPPDFDAQMNALLEKHDTSTPEGVKRFAVATIEVLYDQMVHLAMSGAQSYYLGKSPDGPCSMH